MGTPKAELWGEVSVIIGTKCSLTVKSHSLLGRFGRVAPAVAPRQEPISRKAAPAGTPVRAPLSARAAGRLDWARGTPPQQELSALSSDWAGSGPRGRADKTGGRDWLSMGRRRSLVGEGGGIWFPVVALPPCSFLDQGWRRRIVRRELLRLLVIPATGDAAHMRPTTGQPGKAGLERDSLS